MKKGGVVVIAHVDSASNSNVNVVDVNIRFLVRLKGKLRHRLIPLQL